MLKILLILQTILLITYSIFSFNDDKNVFNRRRVSCIRTAFEVLLTAGSALLMYKIPGRYSYFIFMGTMLSLAGDLIMSDTIKIPGKLMFKMVFSGATCLYYISAFTRLMEVVSKTPYYGLPYIIGIYIIITSVLFMLFVRNSSLGKLVNNTAFLYMMLVSFVASFGTSAAISIGGKYIIFGAAANLFLFSESIVALTEIGKHKITKSSWIIWTSYSLAQVCILTGTVLNFL